MVHRRSPLVWRAAGLFAAALLGHAAPAGAIDIDFVQPAALDQPRINAFLRLAPDANPQSFEGTFNIQAFFDTGASGVLLSQNTAAFLGVDPATAVNPSTGMMEPIIFSDVGVAGSSEFNVSQPIYFGLAPFHPNADIDNISTFTSVYNHTFGPVRAQIGPLNGDPNPLLENLDVFGVPLMRGKVVVMDPKPVDTFLDTMRTYVYDPGTPFNPGEAGSNPGIPETSRSIRFTYGNFDRFTQVTPEGAPRPTTNDNPFIGPHPLASIDPAIPPGDVPGVTVSYNNLATTGSWLFDTGAAASILSEAQAANLGVSYDPATVGSNNPVLLGVPAGEQFTLSIGGIGGVKKVAGFFLDSLLMRTEQGDPGNDDDPNHLRFLNAPVLVSDISLLDPSTSTPFTLDGVLGMNFFVATAFLTEADPFPIIDNLTPGSFDWLVFDEPAGKLRFELKGGAGETSSLFWIADNSGVTTWLPRELAVLFGLPTFVTEGEELMYYQDGDRVTFDDRAQVRRVDLFLDVAPGGVVVNTAGSYTFETETGAKIRGSGGLSKRGPGTLTIETANTYTGPTEIEEGTVIFAVAQNIGPVMVRSGALAIFETSQRFESLLVTGGSAALTGGGGVKVLVTRELSISDGGQLDLADNAMVIDALPGRYEEMVDAVSAMLEAGRNAGTWDGPGLASSTAAADGERLTGLAVVPNRDETGNAIYTMFEGRAVNENSILVKYALNGDMDLSGGIDIDDYFLIDTGFLASQSGMLERPTYRNGDLNYDGMIDIDDYFMIDTAFLGQGSMAASAAMAVAVPEPGGLWLAAGVACWGLARRLRGTRVQPMSTGRRECLAHRKS